MKNRCVLTISLAAVFLLSSCSAGKKTENNTLRLAGIGLDGGYGYSYFITKFQDENPDIVLDITDYASDGDWQTGIERFNAAAVTGDCGDILLCNTFTDVERLAKKRILADLYQTEPVNNKKDSIISNVLESCEAGTGLYSIYPSFSMSAYVCRSSEVAESEWNMEGFPEVADRLVCGERNFIASRSELAFRTMYSSMLNYCNDNGMIDSAGNALIQILDGMKELNDIARDNKNVRCSIEELQEDSIGATEEIIDSFNDYYTLKKGVFMEDISLLGTPLDKNQIMISPDFEIALFEKSKNNPCALKFIEYILSDEVQSFIALSDSGFPVTESGMQRMKELTVSENYYDENGKETGKKDTKFYSSVNESIDIGIPEENDISEIYNTVHTVNIIKRENMSLRNITRDILERFWNDEVSADEALESLISAYSLYNSEKN